MKELKQKNNNSDDYDDRYMKIKMKSDDDLPSERTYNV